ncbi:hypothetical protein GOODEAATRI_020247 [Goodea atripinnis]|uniref:Uncharacterized protein n=1 Tax=Goodea atripinnis TaxID=208336 RepID=A0ABV0PQL2_9TELE
MHRDYMGNDRLTYLDDDQLCRPCTGFTMENHSGILPVTMDQVNSFTHVVVRMFASCCNWLCMDSADVDPSGGTDRRHHSYTNSAFSSQPSPPEPACKACGGSFDAPARKVTPPACCSQIPDGFRQEGFLLIVAYVELVPSLGVAMNDKELKLASDIFL